ncbi:hypothetical protein Tco_0079604 [Tanacetum coccineum]
MNKHKPRTLIIASSIMANLEFYDTHNMVAYLLKPERSKDFQQIVDFLNTSQIKFALTENPTIYTSLIHQFWQTASTSTLEDGEVEITTTIDGQLKTITEASLRRHLKLGDVDGMSLLPNSKKFEQHALMRFIQILLNKHQILLLPHKRSYVAPTLTQKLFSNIRRVSKGYTRVNIPLFSSMLVQSPIQQGEGSKVPVESHHTPITTLSISQPPLSSPYRGRTSADTEILLDQEEPTELVKDLGSGEKGEKEISTANISVSTASVTPEKKAKKKLEQERLRHKEAIRLQEQINEDERQRIARDAEIAKQLQEEFDRARQEQEDSEIEKEVIKRPGFNFQQKSSKKRSREDSDEDNARTETNRMMMRRNSKVILFEPNEDDEIWKNQQDYNLISWRLFDSCGIHMLLMHTGIAIHIMIEKKYPLTQEMLSRMLSRRLKVDQESKMAFELLRRRDVDAICSLAPRGPHESFQYQPMNQNYFEPNPSYSGFDQPSQYPIDQLPSQEMSIQDVEYLKQQYLDEMKKLRQLKQATNVSTHTPEPSRRFNSIYYDDDDDEESTIPLNEIISQLPHVEDLVPIPSEFEDTSGSDSDCDLPSCNDFSPINILEEKSVTFSNPLFDSNDDFTSSDDKSLSDEDVPEDNVKNYSNPLFESDDEYISSNVNLIFDEVLENIESKDSYVCNFDEPALLVTPLSDAKEDECFDPGGDVDEIEVLLHRDPSTPKISVASILEGFTDELPLEENDDLFYLESKENEWKKIVYDAPIDDLMTEDKVFNLGILEKFFSPTYVSLPFEDRHYLSLTYVIRIFLPYFTYPVESPFLLS